MQKHTAQQALALQVFEDRKHVDFASWKCQAVQRSMAEPQAAATNCK